jgi:hypothetical protein
VKAAAIDDSGRQSGVKSETYRFLEIEQVTSQSSSGTPNAFNTYYRDQFIYIHGYGFENVPLEGSVVFRDWDLTDPQTMFVMSKTSTDISVAVSLGSQPFTGNGNSTTDGTVVVRDSSGVSDSILIDLFYLPPP